MIRILFSVLAVVVAVLALVLDQPLLYAVAAVLLLIAFVLLLVVLRRRHEDAKPAYVPPPARPEDDLKSLGIMDIRPKERRPMEAPDARPAERPSGDTAAVDARPPVASPRPPIPAIPPDADVSAPRPKPRTPERADGPADTPRPKASPLPSPAAAPSEAGQAAVVSFLQGLREALEAHTVGLVKQADLTPDYEILALIDDKVRHGGVFSTETPLLSTREGQQAVTVHAVGTAGLPPEHLGYTDRSSDVRQVALAPVPRPNEPEIVFVLADSTGAADLEAPRAQALLAHTARLIGTLLDVPDLPDDRSADAAHDAGDARVDEAGEADEPLRPRREIIADEMEQARAVRQSLALALVYLNRAEDLAHAGAAAVDEAEALLEARLREEVPDGRVERFGELTYGIFFSGRDLRIDRRGEQIQAGFARLPGLLEGGVSVGIALLQDRHQTADAFRADATEALREAYLSGTCTIVE